MARKSRKTLLAELHKAISENEHCIRETQKLHELLTSAKRREAQSQIDREAAESAWRALLKMKSMSNAGGTASHRRL